MSEMVRLYSEIPQNPLRILVADDNETFRAALRGLLMILGHAVTIAADGHEAVEASFQEEYDVVFLDIQMPMMDGWEVARELRLREAGSESLCIIGMSGEPVEEKLYTSVGMNNFLNKPIYFNDLVHILTPLVRR